jgi:hypothetical protein
MSSCWARWILLQCISDYSSYLWCANWTYRSTSLFIALPWTLKKEFCHVSGIWNTRKIFLLLRGCLSSKIGSAIAQAVSSRLVARVWSCGICSGESGAGADFLQVLSLPIFITQVVPQSPSSIIWSSYNSPVVTAETSGLSLTPLRIIK